MVLESNYPTVGGGGAEGQLRTICRYLHQRCVPVEIIVPMRNDGPQVEHDAVDGVDVWRIPYPKIRKFGGIVLLAKLAAALFKRRHEYEVIHAHMANNMAAMCCAIGSMLGKTVIVKITGSLELDNGILDPKQRSPGFVMKRFWFRRASYFQATSKEIHDRLIASGIPEERVRVIPNAVDTRRFAQIAANGAASAESAMTAVCVGRLSTEKAPDVLIRAWIEAFPAEASCQLLLVGDGRMRAELQREIEAAGREHQIRLLGPQADVTPYLSMANVAVIPSHYEGLSNSLLEYMAAGLPVLGTRVSGNVDFIEDRCGWLVNPGDHKMLAEQLRKVMGMQRESLREMGQVGRQRVTSRARIEAVIGKLAELYEIDVEPQKQVAQNRPI